MDQIERQLQLPPEAHPLADYARYYAFDQGRVVGTFARGFDRPSGEHSLRPGERLWLTDPKELPVILDGGCWVVNIVYNTDDARVERVVCNGVA